MEEVTKMNMAMRMLARTVGLGWLPGIGDWLNGKKTILGALALLVFVLDVAPSVYPEMPEGLGQKVAAALKWMGVSLVTVGLAHKADKKLSGDV